jgi:hypothetical protein
MDSLSLYRPGNGSINTATPTIVRVEPMPVTGRYLAHNKLSRAERAFLASDLISGDKLLVRPTISQAAMLSKVNATYVWWAGQREAHRDEILQGWLPLVPPREIKSRAPITDDDLFSIVREAGLARTLEAACAVEAAQ